MPASRLVLSRGRTARHAETERNIRSAPLRHKERTTERPGRTMIEFENFVKQYKDFRLEISMSIPDNRVVGIIGKNGCGKSTTIKAILGW